MESLWCNNQSVDTDGKVICLAHLAEARVSYCPYKDVADRLRSEYPCSDFMENMDRFLGGE